MKSIDRKVATYKRVKYIFAFLFEIGLIALAWYLTRRFEWPEWILWIVIGVTLFHILFYFFIQPSVYVRVAKYIVHQDRIIVRNGFFFVTTKMMPINRVQEVEVSDGIISRKFNLSHLTVKTASSNIKLPPIQMNEAESLQHSILQHLKEEYHA